MKRFAVLFLFILFVFSSLLFAETVSNIPKEGFVPNEITAIRIAEAVWLPIFSEEIYKDKPFKARLEDGVWIVNGTLPKGMLGGTPVAKIAKQDGKILAVYHTQ